MSTLFRVRVAMTGFPGGPGVMTFAANEVNVFIPALTTWLNAIKQYVPPNVTMQVENTGDTYESVTGQTFALYTVGVQSPVAGTASPGYAAPIGFTAEWLTGIYLSGRLLRGRTFVVPCTPAIFTTDGSIENLVLADLRAAAAAMVTNAAGSMSVWQRPRLARLADGSRPAVTARGGGNGTVTGSRVPDKAAVLRSRRD